MLHLAKQATLIFASLMTSNDSCQMHF